MARQSKGRGPATAGAAGRSDQRPTARVPTPPAQASVDQRLAALEAERDALKAEITEARARIATLEATQDEVANRIVWALDSLQTLLEADET
jgi:hypothetical protein